MPKPATLFDKVWASHAIEVRPDGATLLHIDRHHVHDGSSNAFRALKEKGLFVRRPERTFATPDHYVSTQGRTLASISEAHRRSMVEDLENHARDAGVTHFGLADPRQGIVHVVGPEQGLSQPGMIIPAVITVFEDRSFTFITKMPPVSALLKKAAGLAKGSGEPNRTKVGKLTRQQAEDVAKQKMVDLNANSTEAALRMVRGTARSMGIEISE